MSVEVGQLWKSNRSQSLNGIDGDWITVKKGASVLILTDVTAPPWDNLITIWHMDSQSKLLVDISLFGIEKRFDKVSDPE